MKKNSITIFTSFLVQKYFDKEPLKSKLGTYSEKHTKDHTLESERNVFKSKTENTIGKIQDVKNEYQLETIFRKSDLEVMYFLLERLVLIDRYSSQLEKIAFQVLDVSHDTHDIVAQPYQKIYKVLGPLWIHALDLIHSDGLSIDQALEIALS